MVVIGYQRTSNNRQKTYVNEIAGVIFSKVIKKITPYRLILEPKQLKKGWMV